MPKSKTHEEFVKEIYNLNQNIKVLTKYINAHTILKFQCMVCGYTWESTPATIRKSKANCLQCSGKIITPDYYKKIVFDMVGEEYDVLTDYVDCHTKIIYKHNICGTKFEMKPTSFKISHSKCSNPNCKNKIHIQKNREIFIDRANLLGYNVKSEYLGIDAPMKFECQKCNTIFDLNKASKIYEEVDTSHCPTCARRHLISTSAQKFYDEFHNIFNDEFIIVGEYLGFDKPIKILHKKCGKISEYYRTSKILTEYLCPCKHCNITNGEKSIMNYIERKSIMYEYQKKYEDLLGINGGLLSYDFYLPNNNLFIEFQGKQHCEPIDFFGGQEYFKTQQKHDKRKRKYAKDHNIKLLEIWYWDLDNIENILEKELDLTV